MTDEFSSGLLVLSLILNTGLVGVIVHLLWTTMGAARKVKEWSTLNYILGLSEGVLYISSFIVFLRHQDLDKLLLVPLSWVTIKTIGSVWKAKLEENNEPKQTPATLLAGERYNIFLTGTLIQLLNCFFLSEAYVNRSLNIFFTIVISLLIIVLLLLMVNNFRFNPPEAKQSGTKKGG